MTRTTVHGAMVLLAGACASTRTPIGASEAANRSPESPVAAIVAARTAAPSRAPAADRAPVLGLQRASTQGRSVTARSLHRPTIHSRLDQRIPGIDLDGVTSLRDGARLLSKISGVDVVVDNAAEDAFENNGGEFNLSLTRPVRLEDALDLFVEFAGDDIGWTVRHDFVFVSTKDRARGKARTTIIDVQDLLYAQPDFVAPEIGVFASGQDIEFREPEDPRAYIDEDTLIELVRSAVAPGTWDEGDNSIRIENGKLIITHD